MGDSGLSQDDFRRLLRTPRPPPKDDGDHAPPLRSKTPMDSKTPIFGMPASMRRKRAHAPKSMDQKDEKDEEDEPVSQYRDRAAERRQDERDEELGDDTKDTSSRPPGVAKGLDFAKLAKRKAELKAATEQKTLEKEPAQDKPDNHEDVSTAHANEDATMGEAEDELDAVLDKLGSGEQVFSEQNKVTALKADQDSITTGPHLLKRNLPKSNELFEPGRMAFVFKLADEVGHSSEPFAIPDQITHSKESVAKHRQGTGWTDEIVEESKLIIEKITQVMLRVRKPVKPIKPAKSAKPAAKAAPTSIEPPVSVDAAEPEVNMFEGGDIFENVGNDYELDEEEIEQRLKSKVTTQKRNYFDGLGSDDDDTPSESVAEKAGALLLQATEGKTESHDSEDGLASLGRMKRPHMDEIDPGVEPMDEDANDMDMYGLSASVLPKSFEERHRMVHGEEDEGDRTLLMDQGSRRNKKGQLTRWDFDDEEAWQKYKDSVEIAPKGSDQFGVKREDGRKRSRQRRGMNEKQKMNRDYQQVKQMMEKKYGKSIE